MEFDFDHEVRLAKESEFESLYSWSLQEFSKDGTKIGGDQIPWIWTLYFTASEFQYGRSIKIERQQGEEEAAQTFEALTEVIAEELEEEETQQASYNVSADTEWIRAKLQSGTVGRRGRIDREATFSMFGTSREIKDFGLRILKLDDDKAHERCSVWGCVRYTSEVDFRYQTQQDCMEVHLWLSPKRFSELREMLVTDGATLVQVSMYGVSGFYSDWSPSISTDSVKVLTSGDEHGVLTPEGCDISPPRLGTVREFDLSVVHSAIFDSAKRTAMLGSVDDEEGDEEEEEEEEEEEDGDRDGDIERQVSTQEPGLSRNSIVLTHVLRAEELLRGLRVPLWMIVILLVLLLFR
jgi:hypothetical protein